MCTGTKSNSTNGTLTVHPQNVRFQNVWFQNVQFQNVRFTKRQVYKTSGLQNVRFQNVWFQNVQFLNLIYLLNKKYLYLSLLLITSHYGNIWQQNLKNRK